MNEAESLNLPHLARRVVAAREFAGLTQSQLSRKVGFKDRQTLAAIEADQRRVGVPELLAIIKATGKDLDFFTDPFRIVGEGGFSYRAKGSEEVALDDFEERVGKWLALWRYLSEKRGCPPRILRPRLALHEKSTFEEAQRAGEQVARDLKLGKVPAERLAGAIEQELEILLLHADMPKGVSGAAVQLSGGDSILINRNEPGSRQAFDMAHELFHVLTWDAMPPERVDREEPTRYKAKRIEQLADNFAGALLMPGENLTQLWAAKPVTQGMDEWISSVADVFKVSKSALAWRLAALGLISRGDWSPSSKKMRDSKNAEKPPAFSRQYLERVAQGITHGDVSVRRVLEILDIDLHELRTLCKSHAVPLEVGL